MATSVVHRISIHPDAGEDITALSTPALGSNYEADDLQTAGWVTIGSVDLGDDCNLDSESIEQVPLFEGVEILPPGSLTRNDTIVRHNGIDEVTFVAYDVSSDCVELDSTTDITTIEGLVTRGRDVVYRSMIIEIDGIRVDFYPRVMLRISGEPGGFGPGDDAVCKTQFTAIVHAYKSSHGDFAADVPAGRVQGYYAAGT